MHLICAILSYFFQASDKEITWVHRLSVLVIGSISTIIALYVPTIYGLFILAADLVFVVMLPQLTGGYSYRIHAN